MAGTVDLLQRCYGGVEVRPDFLSVRPALPDALSGMSFTIEYVVQREILLIPGERLARAIDLRRSPVWR
jgi:trehalose/maltose hydrolase-like predicted phosphorylase